MDCWFPVIVLGSLFLVWLAFYWFMRLDARKRGEEATFLGKSDEEKKKHEQ